MIPAAALGLGKVASVGKAGGIMSSLGGSIPIPSFTGGAAGPSNAISGIGNTYHYQSKGLGIWSLGAISIIGFMLWKKLK